MEDKKKPGTRPVFTKNISKAHKFDTEWLAKNCLSFIHKDELPSPCSVVKYPRPRPRTSP